MSQKKVVFKRVVSQDGRAIAQAYSEVVTNEESAGVTYQSVSVRVSADGTSSSASSYSSSHASSSASSRDG